MHDPARLCWTWPSLSRWGGDCLADIAMLRAEPAVFGTTASDPTVSRTIAMLAQGAPKALAAIGSARAAARTAAWARAGEHAPDHRIDAEHPSELSDPVRCRVRRGAQGTDVAGRVPDHGPDVLVLIIQGDGFDEVAGQQRSPWTRRCPIGNSR